MSVATRSTCRACGSRRLELLLDYGKMPLAGGFFHPGDIHLNDTFPLRLARCAECTLMQILDTVSPEEIFSQYSYSSSTTQTLSEHFAQMGPELVKIANAVGRLVMEIGCNDGVLLRPLRQAGARVIGIDPSDVALQASQEQNWPLIHDYFTEEVALRLRKEYGVARVVTANNVLAHMEDLHEVMRGVTYLLEEHGLFVFEVHYQGDLLALTQFDTVYHEHTCYHSVTSLSRLLACHGLKILDVQRISIHSGSIRVTATQATSARQVSPVVGQMLDSEKDWDVSRFSCQVEERRRSLCTLVSDLRKAGRRVVAYGAAGRATILLNFCRFGPEMIEYIIDMSPLRYGRLVPGVLVPVVPPEVFQQTPPDYALITAWNYEAEILSKEERFLSGGGRFIIPLPMVRVVGAL